MAKTSTVPSLDLHGYKVDDVPGAVDRFLHQHASRGTPQVRIITGKGTGAVKKKTLEWLKLGGYHHKAENEGSLLIFME